MGRRCDEFGQFEDDLTDELVAETNNCTAEEVVNDLSDAEPMSEEQVMAWRKKLADEADALYLSLMVKATAIDNILETLYCEPINDDQEQKLYATLRVLVREWS
jgi:hypothetical protein